jgi:hypothetical protein
MKLDEQRVDKHEVSGKVVIDGHVFNDAGKSGRVTYGRYSTPDPNYKKDPKEVGMHRNYRKPSSLSFSTLADAKKWVKGQPKKSKEEIDKIHQKHADFEKYMNEELGISRMLSTITHKGSYDKAKKTLSDVMKRKQDSNKGKLYYAAQVAKSYPGVDARKLAAMHEEVPVNNVGGGNIAGLGVGDQGEPGVKKKKKKEVIPFKMFTRK